MSADFYTRLPALTAFAGVADARHYADAPADWWIAVADIEGSTAAVAAGRYREVNYVGAAVIAAVLNAADGADVPFVFGGDGATLLVPPALRDAAADALRGVQATAARAFGLRLRAGLVPVADVRAAGCAVRVGRFQASPHYAQAVFAGGGLAHAEALVKDPARGAAYRLAPGAAAPDLSGLECRWEHVRSPHGETVTLLVQAAPDADDAAAVYQDVLQTLERVYGREAARHPVVPAQLRASFRPRRLAAEAAARAPLRGWPRWRYLAKIWLQNVLLVAFLRFDVRTGATRWRDYPGAIHASTDHRKFDEVLRMVVAGTPAQRAALEHWLAAQHQAGRLAYGLHTSDSALMTCLVYERLGRQVHFVDGAGGGYTQAARALKARA